MSRVGPAGAPLLAAHRIGTPGQAAAAHAAGADLLEIDVHLRRGSLEVRHPRRHGPLLWDREGVRRARGPSPALGPLLAALPAGAEPMIDLKGGSADLARGALDAARAAGLPVATLTSRRWRLLDRLAGEPGVRLAYSAAGRRELGRLLRRALPHGAAACVRSDLLDGAAVAALRRRVALVMTWDVADRANAERLIALGVGGLVVDGMPLLAALAGARSGAAL